MDCAVRSGFIRIDVGCETHYYGTITRPPFDSSSNPTKKNSIEQES